MIVMFAAAVFGGEHLTPKSLIGTVFLVCSLYYLPVFSLMTAIETFHINKFVWLAIFLIGLISWSGLIACVLWKIVATIQGEEEPGGLNNGGRFDWVRFQVRFFCGFVLGCLFGWRFVRNTNSFSTMLIASLVTGLVVGLVFGLSRPPDFWSRGF